MEFPEHGDIRSLLSRLFPVIRVYDMELSVLFYPKRPVVSLGRMNLRRGIVDLWRGFL
jgi:hypothetical protein